MEDKDLKIVSNINIEITKGARRYIFSVPAGAPFGECFDAAFESMEVIKSWHEQAQNKLKNSRPEDLQTEEASLEEVAVEIV